MPDQDDNDGFLMRWSRRKRGVEEEPKAKAPQADTSQTATEEPVSVASLHDSQNVPDVVEQEQTSQVPGAAEATTPEAEAVPADLENVDIETLDYDSDYTRFMQEGVPEALKRRALRQLWRSDPILANVDGLNDYDGDFTDAALAVDVLKTVHKVGRGYLTDDDDEVDELEDTDELEVAEDNQGSDAASAEQPSEATDADAELVAESDDPDDGAIRNDDEQAIAANVDEPKSPNQES